MPTEDPKEPKILYELDTTPKQPSGELFEQFQQASVGERLKVMEMLGMSDDHIAKTLRKTIEASAGHEDSALRTIQELYALGWSTQRIVDNEFAIGGVPQVFWHSGKYTEYLRCAAQTEGNGRRTRYQRVFMKYGRRLTPEMREILFGSIDKRFLAEIEGYTNVDENYAQYLEEKGASTEKV